MTRFSKTEFFLKKRIFAWYQFFSFPTDQYETSENGGHFVGNTVSVSFHDNTGEDFLVPKRDRHNVFLNVVLFADEKRGFIVANHFGRRVSGKLKEIFQLLWGIWENFAYKLLHPRPHLRAFQEQLFCPHFFSTYVHFWHPSVLKPLFLLTERRNTETSSNNQIRLGVHLILWHENGDILPRNVVDVENNFVSERAQPSAGIILRQFRKINKNWLSLKKNTEWFCRNLKTIMKTAPKSLFYLRIETGENHPVFRVFLSDFNNSFRSDWKQELDWGWTWSQKSQ